MAMQIERRLPGLWPGWLSQTMPRSILDPLMDLEPMMPSGWSDRDGMHLEEFRDDDTLVVRAELPGIDPDTDVEITVSDGSLCIRAERRESHERTGNGDFYRSEFRYGQFTRTLPLPAGAGADDVKASYDDGILEIRLPMASPSPSVSRVAVTRGKG
jgi:HSP20 family protein